MKTFSKYILKSGFVALLFGGVLSPLSSLAVCSLVGKQSSPNLAASTIVASLNKGNWDYIDQTDRQNVISIQECNSTGTLQISKIAVTYNPENYQPQIYDSTKMHNMPVTCNITTDIPKNYSPTDHFNQYVKLSSYVNQCIGIKIESVDMITILPIASPTCEFSFIDAQKTKVIAKGENCQIDRPKGNYAISPVYLDSCAQTDIAKGGIANVETLFTVLETDGGSNALARKSVQLVINPEDQSLPVAVTRYQSHKIEMTRPSDYNIDIDFAQISLTGNSKSKVTASAKYFVQNRTECSGNSCLSASSYRVPLVIENDLYLAKANNLGERVFLGRWYNASIVPAQWSGVDGNPVMNAVGFNWNAIELNQNFSQAETGDSLVLVSRLVNPNRGIKSFLNAGETYFTSQRSLKAPTVRSSLYSSSSAGSSGNINGVGTVSAVSTIHFKNEISTIDFDSVVNNQSAASIDAGMLWVVRYERYCSQTNQNNCSNLGEISDLINLETEIKITKFDETGLEVHPVATLKASAISENSYLSKLTQPLKIQCLNPEVLNTDIIRRKK